MKKSISIIGNVIFYSLLIGFIAITLWGVRSIQTGNQIPIMGYRMYSVLSGSMEPTIGKGSVIFVKELEKEKIEKGDVITFGFEENNNLVTHRVIEVINNGESFITRGDANNGDDPNPIKYEQVKGIVTTTIPNVGKVVNFTKDNIIIIISTIVIISFVSYVIKVIKYKEVEIKTKDGGKENE